MANSRCQTDNSCQSCTGAVLPSLGSCTISILFYDGIAFKPIPLRSQRKVCPPFSTATGDFTRNLCRMDFECSRDLSSSASPGYNFRVTKEPWAQMGITIEFLIVVRTPGEFFRLRHAQDTSCSIAVAALCVGGALIAACSCWAG